MTTNYKEHLEHYQEVIREKITDIQKRSTQLNRDIHELSVYIQSGIFYNCLKELEQPQLEDKCN